MIISVSSHSSPLAYVRRLLGTPNDAVWPGVESMEHWLRAFPSWPTRPITFDGDRIGESGVKLLSDMLRLCPEERPQAAAALTYAYFVAGGTTKTPAGAE